LLKGQGQNTAQRMTLLVAGVLGLFLVRRLKQFNKSRISFTHRK
jgi:hypothetical protein